MRPPVAPIGWPSEMPEPLTLTRSRSASAEVPPAEAGEDLRGERLVELDEVDVRPAEARALQGALGRRHRTDAHPVGLHPGERPADQPRQRTQPQLLRLAAGW